MSSAKFESLPYKLFEPHFHVRPIIIGVDPGLESPESATIKFEEAAARAQGGGLREDSPPGLIPIPMSYENPKPAQMHDYESARPYHEPPPYTHYSAQTYAPSVETQSTQPYSNVESADPQQFATVESQPQSYAPSESQDSQAYAAPQATGSVNQEPFASNSDVTPYFPSGPAWLSTEPARGSAGTKISLKISCGYDMLLMTPPPFFAVAFGSQKAQAAVIPDSQEGSFTYTVTAAAPHHSVTGCGDSSVPLALVIEDASGHEISKTAAGEFVYEPAPEGPEGPEGGIARDVRCKPQESQGTRAPASILAHANNPPSSEGRVQPPHLTSDPATNSFPFPGAAGTSQQASPYATHFSQAAENNMLTTYSRSTSFTDPFPRVPPSSALRSPSAAWPTYSGALAPARRPAISHTAMSRPSLTPPPLATPQLIRMSTLQPSARATFAYTPYAMLPNKAVLKIIGKLDTMAEHWTQEEWDNRRRIVVFKKQQTGSTLTVSFRGVNVNERPPNSICISCIWWAEKNECFVTSVDTIHLLEQLVAAPSRFTVEEKNRIRRNLEGFRPLTVSKAKPDSEDFFKIIMAFPNPKPRNIEKDVKVFPWRILEQALKKIIGKYSASPSSTIPPAQLSVNTGPYPTLPTPPALGPGAPEPLSAYGVPTAQHHEVLASPRSLSGGIPSNMYSAVSASAYAASAAARTMSPPRTCSPLPSVMRSAPLPPVTTYDSRAGLPAGSYSTGLHTALAHPPSSAPPRWATTPTTYSESYSTLSAPHSSHSVYGPGAYGDGTP